MGRVERNMLWLTAANVLSSCFTVGLFIYLARVLESGNFGYLSYASALVYFFINFIDLGLSTYGIREVAKNHQGAPDYVSNIVSFRMMMAAILFAGFVIISPLTHQGALVKVLMIETSLMCFVSALASEWAFQGLEKMHVVFASMAVTSFLQLALSLIIVRSPDDVLKVPLINAAASVSAIIFLLRRLKFRLHLLSLDLKKIRLYLSSAIIIWSISMFAQVYSSFDIAILGLFRSPQEVGCFSVARRITGGITLLMTCLTGAVLPHLSHAFTADMPAFHRGTQKYLKISGIILVVFFLPIMIFSRQIITATVGGEYIQAAMPLKIMMIAIILITINLPFSTGLIAACMEREVLKQAFASALLSVFLNIILIPRCGMIGASISFLCAELLALIWILNVYRCRIRVNAG